MNKQQACEYIERNGGWKAMEFTVRIADDLNIVEVSKKDYEQYIKDKRERMSEDLEQKRYWKEGEELEVGMIVGGFHLESKVVLLPDRNGDLIISPLDMDCWIRRNLSNIKAADPRTDKQKAVDAINVTLSFANDEIVDVWRTHKKIQH